MFFIFINLTRDFIYFAYFQNLWWTSKTKKKLLLILVISIAFLLMEQNFAFTIILCSLRYSSQIQERMNKGADLV